MATETGLKTNYRMEIEVLSPLHIGAGKGNLIFDYDYVGHRGTIWVIDQEKLLESVGDDELLKAGSVEPRVSRFLQPAQYAAYAKYQLSCLGQVPQEIFPFVKDVWGRPYLPGSSLKGAMRTAIAWSTYGQNGARLDAATLDGDSRRADNRLEEKLFGGDTPHDYRQNPNYDVMRALQVGDSASPDGRGDLALARVSLFTLRGASLEPKGSRYQWALEVLPAQTKLVASLGIDEFILGPPSRKLGLEGKQGLVKQLATHCRDQARSVIGHEAEFYRKAGLPSIRQFYEKLGEDTGRLGENELMLQISWGAGWRSKTLGSRLEYDGSLQRVRSWYRLGYRDAPFPKTRRLVERGGVPEAPLGWLKIRMV